MARTLVDFPTNLVKAFENVTTLKKKYTIIGSSILKAKRYVSDYDINQESVRPLKTFKSCLTGLLKHQILISAISRQGG